MISEVLLYRGYCRVLRGGVCVISEVLLYRGYSNTRSHTARRVVLGS